MTKKLYRSSTDRVIAGVCGGLATYLDLDAVFIRLIFLALTVFGGAGVLLYLIAIILIPEEGGTAPVKTKDIEEGVRQAASKIKTTAEGVAQSGRIEHIIGVAIFCIGVILLVQIFAGIFQLFHLWPAVLVLIGLIILIRK